MDSNLHITFQKTSMPVDVMQDLIRLIGKNNLPIFRAAVNDWVTKHYNEFRFSKDPTYQTAYAIELYATCLVQHVPEYWQHYNEFKTMNRTADILTQFADPHGINVGAQFKNIIGHQNTILHIRAVDSYDVLKDKYPTGRIATLDQQWENVYQPDSKVVAFDRGDDEINFMLYDRFWSFVKGNTFQKVADLTETEAKHLVSIHTHGKPYTYLNGELIVGELGKDHSVTVPHGDVTGRFYPDGSVVSIWKATKSRQQIVDALFALVQAGHIKRDAMVWDSAMNTMEPMQDFMAKTADIVTAVPAHEDEEGNWHFAQPLPYDQLPDDIKEKAMENYRYDWNHLDIDEEVSNFVYDAKEYGLSLTVKKADTNPLGVECSISVLEWGVFTKRLLKYYQAKKRSTPLPILSQNTVEDIPKTAWKAMLEGFINIEWYNETAHVEDYGASDHYSRVQFEWVNVLNAIDSLVTDYFFDLEKKYAKWLDAAEQPPNEEEMAENFRANQYTFDEEGKIASTMGTNVKFADILSNFPVSPIRTQPPVHSEWEVKGTSMRPLLENNPRASYVDVMQIGHPDYPRTNSGRAVSNFLKQTHWTDSQFIGITRRDAIMHPEEVVLTTYGTPSSGRDWLFFSIDAFYYLLKPRQAQVTADIISGQPAEEMIVTWDDLPQHIRPYQVWSSAKDPFQLGSYLFVIDPTIIDAKVTAYAGSYKYRGFKIAQGFWSPYLFNEKYVREWMNHPEFPPTVWTEDNKDAKPMKFRLVDNDFRTELTNVAALKFSDIVNRFPSPQEEYAREENNADWEKRAIELLNDFEPSETHYADQEDEILASGLMFGDWLYMNDPIAFNQYTIEIRQQSSQSSGNRQVIVKQSSGLKVFLDDAREAPEGWTRTTSSAETIDLLKTSNVEALSLDHDLSETDNGYKVLLWIEEQVHTNGFKPPIMNIHSMNSSARAKMELAIKSIEEAAQKNISLTFDQARDFEKRLTHRLEVGKTKVLAEGVKEGDANKLVKWWNDIVSPDTYGVVYQDCNDGKYFGYKYFAPMDSFLAMYRPSKSVTASMDNEIFVAIEVPKRVRKKYNHIEDLDEDLHVTMLFVPNAKTTDAQKESIVHAIAKVAKSHDPLACSFTGLGNFDNGSDTLVALVNVPEGAALHTEIEGEVERINGAWEKRYGYLPHCTLNMKGDGESDLDDLRKFKWTAKELRINFSDPADVAYYVELGTGKIREVRKTKKTADILNMEETDVWMYRIGDSFQFVTDTESFEKVWYYLEHNMLPEYKQKIYDAGHHFMYDFAHSCPITLLSFNLRNRTAIFGIYNPLDPSIKLLEMDIPFEDVYTDLAQVSRKTSTVSQPIRDQLDYPRFNLSAKDTVEQAGAIYDGLKDWGAQGWIVFFTNKQTGSTNVLPLNQLTIENVQAKLKEVS